MIELSSGESYIEADEASLDQVSTEEGKRDNIKDIKTEVMKTLGRLMKTLSKHSAKSEKSRIHGAPVTRPQREPA